MASILGRLALRLASKQPTIRRIGVYGTVVVGVVAVAVCTVAWKGGRATYAWARERKIWHPATVALAATDVPAPVATPTSPKHAIALSDELFDGGQERVPEMFALLQTAVKNDPKNAELLWRLARASRLMVLDVRTNSDDKKRLAYDCLKYAKEAVKADDGNWAAHKWLAIGYKVVGDYEGTKSKIQNAYVIRDEFRRALELNPTDATTTCLLGQWCFYFADMPWYERQIAGTLFASPPTSTFEEALAFFHKAEKLSPGFYKTNKMYLAKSYSRLGQKEEARKWRDEALAMPNKTLDDESAEKEAKALNL